MRSLLTVTGGRHRARHGHVGRLWPDRYRCETVADTVSLSALVVVLTTAALAEGRGGYPWVRLPGHAERDDGMASPKLRAGAD